MKKAVLATKKAAKKVKSTAKKAAETVKKATKAATKQVKKTAKKAVTKAKQNVKTAIKDTKKVMTKVGGKVAVAYTSFKEGGYKGIISAGLDFIPIVGNAKALVEAAIGRDPITGRKLESWERGASAAAILGGPLVKGVKHGAKLGANAISGATSSSKKTVNLAKSPTPTNPTKQQAPSQAKKEASATTAPPAKANQNTKGTSKETYQHLKDYKNNKYFTRSVEYNAGKDGTGFTYKVYQRGDIDWDMVRTKGAKKGRGLTNAEASAKHGLAPILDDAGSVATLHHSQQKGVGPLYEASTRYHNISNAKRAPLHPYKGKLNPFYPMDETTRGAFQKVDSINYWKTRGEEALGGK
ncbi:pre-toxin TG domain-containing protein [Solibacillus sp. FSL R7-0682]|uniref:pre-toxin TG domain-containing protein n=1 Tax=Solibacillus sp. FSL R7-0682 TaxID=2921690 RepID=UPI0030FB92CE